MKKPNSIKTGLWDYSNNMPLDIGSILCVARLIVLSLCGDYRNVTNYDNRKFTA
jgi:hypothetical protein